MAGIIGLEYKKASAGVAPKCTVNTAAEPWKVLPIGGWTGVSGGSKSAGGVYSTNAATGTDVSIASSSTTSTNLNYWRGGFFCVLT